WKEKIMTPFSEASASHRAQQLMRDQAVQAAAVCRSATGEIQIRILRWMEHGGDYALLQHVEDTIATATPEAHETSIATPTDRIVAGAAAVLLTLTKRGNFPPAGNSE
ncbi:MAG TPA: hypothetical protein VGK57_08535, partial [Candidatus Binatia bacterium]